MKRKFLYGIWEMPKWNGMEDFKNGMEDNLNLSVAMVQTSILPYQFHSRFRSWRLQKKIYGYR